MIYFFDTYYQEHSALTAVIGIEDWKQSTPSLSLTHTTQNVCPYESGAFYKRELPCILETIDKLELTTQDIIVVDGYVYLSDDQKLGLGGYLFQSLQQSIPVIGVAKNDFRQISILKKEVWRGESKNPLYITSAGIDLEQAATYIQSMEGPYRMPTILKLVDQLSRS